jgi:hypothetical protein
MNFISNQIEISTTIIPVILSEAKDLDSSVALLPQNDSFSLLAEIPESVGWAMPPK